MNTLLLDSSAEYLSVALKTDKEFLKLRYECFQRQSEFMIVEIDKLLKKANIEAKDVNEILLSEGPGSYTGLRISLTIAKIYGYSLNIPVYVYSSLDILKNKDKPSICLMNARSKRCYIGVYDKANCLVKDQVMSNEDVLKYISDHLDYAICGNTSYLDIKGENNDIFENMLAYKSEDKKVKDILSLKALYLKD